jgi:hypothetical protein
MNTTVYLLSYYIRFLENSSERQFLANGTSWPASRAKKIMRIIEKMGVAGIRLELDWSTMMVGLWCMANLVNARRDIKCSWSEAGEMKFISIRERQQNQNSGSTTTTHHYIFFFVLSKTLLDRTARKIFLVGTWRASLLS